MPLARSTAADIVNQVALEVGLLPVTDPYASNDPNFIQLRGLLNSAGRHLVAVFPWEQLVKSNQFTTAALDTGDYPLPNDFAYMIDQTGWERSNRMPLFGPLSAQEWTYLLGRDLVTSTIYASFRIREGLFSLFPQPPQAGLNINYEYISRNWVQDATNPAVFRDKVQNTADIVLFEPELIEAALKVDFLTAKGFPAAAAEREYEFLLGSWTGKDKGAPIVSLSRNRLRYPYIDPIYNLPDSGYGNP